MEWKKIASMQYGKSSFIAFHTGVPERQKGKGG